MAKEYTAKTVEEAVQAGLTDLNITIDQADYIVIEQPSKGFMGLGAKSAKISMTKKKSDADKAADFLDGLFDILKIKATTDIKEDNDEKIIVNLISTDSSSLIGYRGEVLDSLQCLASAVANKNNENYKRVVVDCEGYRDKREETLKSLAEKLANKAIKTSRKVSLEPMNPFERRIIHSALVDFEGVKTVSEGKEPARFVVIIPDNFDPTKVERRPFKGGDHRNGGRDGGRDNRGGNRFDGRRNGSRDGGRDNRGGNRFDGRRNGGRSDMKSAPKKVGFGGGVFLGNSLKNNDENKTENKD